MTNLPSVIRVEMVMTNLPSVIHTYSWASHQRPIQLGLDWTPNLHLKNMPKVQQVMVGLKPLDGQTSKYSSALFAVHVKQI